MHTGLTLAVAGYTTSTMKTLDLKEPEASYDFERSTAGPAQEPMKVIHGEEVIGVLVPVREYAAFRAWRESQGEQSQPDFSSSLEREAEAFEHMKTELLQKYRGRVVAILDGRVREVGKPEERVAEVAGRLEQPVALALGMAPTTRLRAYVPPTPTATPPPTATPLRRRPVPHRPRRR